MTDSFYEGEDVPNLANDPKFKRFWPDREQSRAMRDVHAERFRQQEVEKWSTTHDDEYYNGEMASAGAAYAVATNFPGYAEKIWPWDSLWWKPTTARRNLVKAAALLIAEIERLDRIVSPCPPIPVQDVRSAGPEPGEPR